MAPGQVKRFIVCFVAVELLIAATNDPSVVATVSAKLIITERSELQTEIPQPDGMNKKQVFEIFQDRVLSTTFNGEIINATNTVDTGKGIIKIVPEDSRRVR